MGRIIYDSQTLQMDIDDRTLLHLQLAIVAKLRRGESFTFTWKNSQAQGDGRVSLWLDRSIPLQFVYDGGHAAEVNKAWLKALSDTSNSGMGLYLIPEGDVPNPQP
ncbi:ATP-dependent DNA ligase [Curtobacterium sp. MCPF17_002]|uniref:DUF7882 family protein n=1 Tax=Curtobacterium sp. MCPF17_002 TaxID=2175645 RepID=UPI000DAA4F24|nr:ATP-dependent DNA ligase [Curtobacterium sp. MCPF17_002]WIB77964.1 ATP-dependent DNA ligase [Curtobacterium sp. MCPF17_002]